MAEVKAYNDNQGTKQTERVTFEDSPPSEAYEGRPAGQLAVAWAVVGIPFAFGLIATVVKALPLFR